MGTGVAGGWPVPVASGEVLRLLATVRAGRVAYVDQALPGIQVATHVVDGGAVIIRSQGRSPVISRGGLGRLCWLMRRVRSILRRWRGGA